MHIPNKRKRNKNEKEDELKSQHNIVQFVENTLQKDWLHKG